MTELEQQRRQHNITQQQIADYLGVTRNTVYRWETGECKPSAENLKRLNELFRSTEQTTEDNTIFLTPSWQEVTISESESVSAFVYPLEKSEKRLFWKKFLLTLGLIANFCAILAVGLFCAICISQIRADLVFGNQGYGTHSTPSLIPLNWGTLILGLALLGFLIYLLIKISRFLWRKKK